MPLCLLFLSLQKGKYHALSKKLVNTTLMTTSEWKGEKSPLADPFMTVLDNPSNVQHGRHCIQPVLS